MKWKKQKHDLINSVNYLYRGKGFYISYNPNVESSEMVQALDGLLRTLQGKSQKDIPDDKSETALYNEKSDKFYILVGDWRKEYEKVIPKGYKACKKLFDRNIKHKSITSN